MGRDESCDSLAVRLASGHESYKSIEDVSFSCSRRTAKEQSRKRTFPLSIYVPDSGDSCLDTFVRNDVVESEAGRSENLKDELIHGMIL